MPSVKYLQQAQELAKAIDIAIAAVQAHPPQDFTAENIQTFVKFYQDAKQSALEPEPAFATVASLKFTINNVLTYFLEASGEAVDQFWLAVKQQELPYKRKNRLAKILKRGKIKNKVEYNLVVDQIVVYQQEGLINATEFEALSQMIGEFEAAGIE